MESIKHFFAQLFTQLSVEDSWVVLGMLLGAFLIGLITTYFMYRSRIKALEEALKKNEKATTLVKTQLGTLQEQHALQEADLKKSNLELEEKRESVEALEAEKRQLNSRLGTTLADLDKSKEELREATGRMEDLNDQILGLRTKNAQLSAELEQRVASITKYAVGQTSTATIQQLEEKIAALNQEKASLIDQLKTANSSVTGYEALEMRIAELEAENSKLEDLLAEVNQLEGGNEVLSSTITSLIQDNERLKEQLEELPQYEEGNSALGRSIHTLVEENEQLREQAEAVIQYETGNEILNTTIAQLIEQNEKLENELSNAKDHQVEWEVEVPEEKDVEEMDVEEAKAQIVAAIGTQIKTATPAERDDLKQINGIGPFIEEKLNELGIYTFEQISQLNDHLVETLTTAIEFFPGRIDRDDWVGQADRLFYTKGSSPQEMTTITATPVSVGKETIVKTKTVAKKTTSIKSDDLKKIEGIGPKIAQLLNDAGIHTFAKLAKTSTDQISKILLEAGSRYKMHDPTTWPEQAKIAAAGDWEKLKELQDYLDGGRDVAKG